MRGKNRNTPESIRDVLHKELANFAEKCRNHSARDDNLPVVPW